MPKLAFFEVTFQALEDFLVPEGHHIVEVWTDLEDKYARKFKVVVEGPDLPDVLEGTTLSRIGLVLRKGDACPECGWREAKVTFTDA